MHLNIRRQRQTINPPSTKEPEFFFYYFRMLKLSKIIELNVLYRRQGE